MSLDQVSNEARQELEAFAAKHPNFRTFADEMQRLAELVWHNMRGTETPQPAAQTAETQEVPQPAQGTAPEQNPYQTDQQQQPAS